jgi:hypothetical protein
MHLKTVRCQHCQHDCAEAETKATACRPGALTAVQKATPQGCCFSLLFALRWLAGFFLQREDRP